VGGKKITSHKPCSSPSKFHVNGQHFCGVHKFTLANHPDAGKTFVCKTDVVVCSTVYGMALAHSLNERCMWWNIAKEWGGGTAGVGMKLPFSPLSTSKDAELRPAVPRAIPELGSENSLRIADRQSGLDRTGYGPFAFGANTSPLSSKRPVLLAVMGGRNNRPTRRSNRIRPYALHQVDYGMGCASSQKAKRGSKNRRGPKPKSGGRSLAGDNGCDSTKEMFGKLLMAPMGAALALEVFVAPSGAPA
jgi:hypothetical protein